MTTPFQSRMMAAACSARSRRECCGLEGRSKIQTVVVFPSAAVVSKYVKIQPKDIKVSFERQRNIEVLEVKIELPDTVR